MRCAKPSRRTHIASSTRISSAAGPWSEVFLSLNQAQWLCTTDARGNVNRLERR